MGVPLIATSWWSLLLGLYGYILPFVLYASWVAIAMWDLIRRDADAITERRGGWRSCCSCRSSGRCSTSRSAGPSIPAQLRLMLTAGGVVAYLVFLALGRRLRRLTQSSSWIRIRLKALPFDSVLTTVT